jgi:hypothetical protein
MTQYRLGRFAALLALTLLPLGVLAQAAPVQRPELKVGDRWKMEVQDPLTKMIRTTIEEVVVSLDATKIGVTIDGQPGTVSPDLTVLDYYRVSYDNGYQWLRFPLEPGKKWDFKTQWTAKQSGASGRSQFDVEVLSRESITVPAGTFEALKLRAKGYMNADRGGTWSVTMTYWYAPQAKKIVRSEWRDNKHDEDSNRQLIEYKLAD